MDQMSVPDSRQRSRSKTPFLLRSHCDKENCTENDHLHGPVKKSPTVQTISEETVNQSQSLSTTTTTTPTPTAAPILPAATVTQKSVATTIQSNAQSSSTTVTTSSTRLTRNAKPTVVEQIVEQVSVTQATVLKRKSGGGSDGIGGASIIQSVTTTSGGNVSSKKSLASDEKQVTKKSVTVVKSKEMNQNELNQQFEEQATPMKTSTPKAERSESRRQYNNNGDLSNHLAYKEYKAAGEYWNKYPKTDYTYSKLSPHRRELAPGIVAMPNMSRRSLEHHRDRVDTMAQSNPSQEAYIRARYQSSNYQAYDRKEFRQENYYDSQDEVDLSDINQSRYSSTYSSAHGNGQLLETKNIFQRFTMAIARTWYRMTSVFRRQSANNSNLYYTRTDEKQGVIRRSASFVGNSFLAVFRYLYLFISSIIFLDTKLLQTKNAENGHKKRFLLLLLILLPFLLLAAWSLTDLSERQQFLSKLPMQSFSAVPLVYGSLKAATKDVIGLLENPNSWTKSKSPSDTIQNVLTDNQYQNLLNHINSYIETAIDDKTKNLQIPPTKPNDEVKLLIASLVKENLIFYKYELTASDIDQIVNAVLMKLDQRPSIKFDLTPDHLNEIQKIVRDTFVQQSEQSQMDAKSNESIDKILLTILSSPKMIDLIDQHVLNQLNPGKEMAAKQQFLLDQMNAEIDALKLKLNDRQKENVDLQHSLNVLQNHQNSLVDQLTMLESGYKDKFEKLLADLDLKLSDLRSNDFGAIDERIRIILSDIIGYTNADNTNGLSDIDLKNWIQSIFVSKKLLEEKLTGLLNTVDGQLKDELNRSAAILLKEISDRIKIEVLATIERNNNIQFDNVEQREQYIQGVGMNESSIRKLIKEVLAVYDADKTGLVDYALESSGGEVLSTRCTENYRTKSAQLSIFGIPLWYQTNTPRTAISPSVQPGQCWAFQAFPGFLVLKLSCMVFVNGFTLEHIPKALAPNGRINSAPKQFTVWGLDQEIDSDPALFGTYQYDENGTSLQYFSVQNKDIQRSFNVVELRIESNHGHDSYTCLYRFRVHGIPDT